MKNSYKEKGTLDWIVELNDIQLGVSFTHEKIQGNDLGFGTMGEIPETKEEQIKAICQSIVSFSATRALLEQKARNINPRTIIEILRNPDSIMEAEIAIVAIGREIKKMTIELLKLKNPEEYENLLVKCDAKFLGKDEVLNKNEIYDVRCYNIPPNRNLKQDPYCKCIVTGIEKEFKYENPKAMFEDWKLIENENTIKFAE